MDRECGTYGGETRTVFLCRKLKEGNPLEDLPLEGNNIEIYQKEVR